MLEPAPTGPDCQRCKYWGWHNYAKCYFLVTFKGNFGNHGAGNNHREPTSSGQKCRYPPPTNRIDDVFGHPPTNKELAVYSWKLIGYLFPRRFAENKAVAGFASMLTIALLASWTAVQSLTSSNSIELDSRLLAVTVAGVLFWKKLPFLLVITVAATVAALARFLLGWQ